MLRTTTALTVMKAGNKENVMPGLAEAVVNFRLLPGDTIASVTDHVRQKAGSDRFELIALPGAAEASPVSPDATRRRTSSSTAPCASCFPMCWWRQG
jgi:carboxypeptidase PM20D1